MGTAPRPGPAILAAALPMFMASLNNLVVTNSLPLIGRDMAASETNLQWVVNGYVLAFAGLMLTGAALGDRFGRRRVFLWGIGVFALGSIACAFSPAVFLLIPARVLQGVGAAAMLPLSLTLVTASVPAERRGAAIGLWGGVNGLGVALGPLVGGLVANLFSWQGIFYINVAVALVAVPLLLRFVPESRGRDSELDLLGMVLVTAAVVFLVLAIVRTSREGWTSSHVLVLFACVVVLLVLFLVWERRAPHPLLPLRFYRNRAFVLSNVVSLTMFFGMFGAIFLMTQYLQGPLDLSALTAGVWTLPWTASPMLLAPVAGMVAGRLGTGRLMAAGLAVQAGALAWLALVADVYVPYSRIVAALALAGIGMGLVLAPNALAVFGSVADDEHGKASGANNTLREIGGALGVAVSTSVFSARFNGVRVRTPLQGFQLFVHGMTTALWVSVAVLAAGAVAALCIPHVRDGRRAGRPRAASRADELVRSS